MKKKLRIILKAAAILIALGLLLLFVCDRIIVSNTQGKVFSELDSIAPTEWGLLLGTTPQTRIGRRQNMFFTYRIEAAEQLYKAGKIKRVLISGDANSLDGVNEVACMRDSLVTRGVSADDIVLDGKGYRTLDSVIRAVKVYGIHSFVVISQQFHNERTVYLAEHLGLDIERVVGYNAADATSGTSFLTYIREYFARVKVFIDLLTGKEPASYE